MSGAGQLLCVWGRSTTMQRDAEPCNRWACKLTGWVRVQANLVDAFSEGKSGNPLRISLKNARAQQGAIERAAARYALGLAPEYGLNDSRFGAVNDEKILDQ